MYFSSSTLWFHYQQRAVEGAQPISMVALCQHFLTISKTMNLTTCYDVIFVDSYFIVLILKQ